MISRRRVKVNAQPSKRNIEQWRLPPGLTVTPENGLVYVSEILAKAGVIFTHPFDIKTPTAIDFSKITRANAGQLVLMIKSYQSPGKGGRIVVKGGHATPSAAKIDVADPWRTIEVVFEHESVLVEHHALGWNCEGMFFDYQIKNKPSGPVRVVERNAKTPIVTGTEAAPKREPPSDSPPARPVPLAAPFDGPAARRGQQAWAAHLKTPIESTNSIGMKFKLIPPGVFTMGSPPSDQDAEDDEKPAHRVRLSTFYLGVTRGHPKAVLGRDRDYPKRVLVDWRRKSKSRRTIYRPASRRERLLVRCNQLLQCPEFA